LAEKEKMYRKIGPLDGRIGLDSLGVFWRSDIYFEFIIVLDDKHLEHKLSEMVKQCQTSP
jgi:hypothetical protein